MSAPRDAVIGGGIVGLALATALARRGREVTVFEADAQPQGASARNFGTLWPIGQPAGVRRGLALESMAAWREVLAQSGAWAAPVGSLHVAYHDDEWDVLTEFAGQAQADGLACRLLSPAETLARQERIRARGLRGSLWSPHEMQVNPRQVLTRVAAWLAERWRVRFERGTRVTSCAGGAVRAGTRTWRCERIWLATGDDLRTLYPETLAALGLRVCKLQMMRTSPVSWPLGPILAAGLTLGHYESFAACPSLPALKARLRRDWPGQAAYGVHVLVAQHDEGHLVIGDSHEYDDAVAPFDKVEVDRLVLEYLDTFLDAGGASVSERWHGVYVKHPRDPYCICTPEEGVTALVGLGGHGMTLSFGLADRLVRECLDG